MSERFLIQSLSGWGRFPSEPCSVFRPEKQLSLNEILRSGLCSSYICRGSGRSYGDAALNRGQGVISHTRLNRLLAFDPETGILESEAGITFDEILRGFLPRGFSLPVIPGTKFATLGGAIAADVHGKNHHCDGSFARFVLDFKLLLSTGEVLSCSPTQNAIEFWAALGGMGLTGILLSARIRLQPVKTAYLQVETRTAPGLDETLLELSSSDLHYQYTVAWVDGFSKGRSLGRAVIKRANHVGPAELSSAIQNPLALPLKKQRRIPIQASSFALNPMSVSLFNQFFYHRSKNATSQLEDFETFFYPLDALQDWNRLYGRKGFVQYQIALPDEAGSGALADLFEGLGRSKNSPFLAVLKRMGEGNPGLLSFPMKGYSLALDFPMTSSLIPFLHEFDRRVLNDGGRIYLAKDSILTPEVFTDMYPGASRLREIKQKIDPQGIFSSSLSRRLQLGFTEKRSERK
jgi:FAD/FMN-containing dehydrogenase